MITCVAPGASAQPDARSAARRVAELAVHDGRFEAGTSVSLTVHDTHDAGLLREGIIEGLLASGMTVLGDDRGGEADLALTFVARGERADALTMSVVGSLQGADTFVFSKAYVVELEESSVLETILAPVVVVSSAILVVYLLLTVRSS